MRLLLDTHIAVWAVAASPLLSAKARDMIGPRENTIFVSAISIWEIAIKHALGNKGAPPFSGADAIEAFREAGYRLLDVSAMHAAATERLPQVHRDPFDRLLVAQALTEPLRLLTRDARLAAYSPEIVLV